MLKNIHLVKSFNMLPILLLVVVSVLTACSPSLQPQAMDTVNIAVTVLPQEEFVKSIGGSRVNVTVMIPPGASPHTYEITPSQMALLSKARAYFKVGSPIEFELTWLDKFVAANRDMLVVDCSKGVALMDSMDPDEPGIDPHIWTSVRNVKIMVKNICAGLSQLDPAGTSYYEANRDRYLAELEKLDTDIAASLSGKENTQFIVYHPAWGYFAKDYGLKQISIEQGGKEPGAAYLGRLIDKARELKIKIIFVSPEYDARSAEAVAHEIGGRVVIIDPLAEDYLTNMHIVSNAIQEAVK